ATLWVGSGALCVSYFLKTVTDDSTPRSLQPFLQRASTLTVSAYVAGYDTAPMPDGQNYHERQGGISIGLDMYVRRYLAVWGDVRMDAVTLTSITAWRQSASSATSVEWSAFAVPLSAGVGLHLRDTRIDVAYKLTPVMDFAGSWQAPFLGRV